MSRSVPKTSTALHSAAISYGRAPYMLHEGHRASCTCGWISDCYVQLSDTRRAIDVHLRRVRLIDFDTRLSSVGADVPVGYPRKRSPSHKAACP